MKIYVDPELKDLIPDFLNNRREDIKNIQSATINSDFNTISLIGHNLKGIGSSYGFDDITVFGKALEAAGFCQDMRVIRILTQKLSDFLENVEIIYR